MDARLDTLSDELCHANTRVSRITRHQAYMVGFVASPSPSPFPAAFKDEDDDDGSNSNDDADVDESLYRNFFVRGSVFVYKGCSEDFCIFSFLSLLDTLSFLHWSCDHLMIENIIFILDICVYIYIYIFDDVVITFHLSLHVLFLFSLYTHVSYYCM